MSATNGDTPGWIVPVAVGAADAGRMIGLSERQWRRLAAAGQVPRGFRIGRAKRWSIAEITAWVGHGCPAQQRWETMEEARTGMASGDGLRSRTTRHGMPRTATRMA